MLTDKKKANNHFKTDRTRAVVLPGTTIYQKIPVSIGEEVGTSSYLGTQA